MYIHMQKNVTYPFNNWHILSDICDELIQQITKKENYVVKLNLDYIYYMKK
jgi:hypothetical protein